MLTATKTRTLTKVKAEKLISDMRAGFMQAQTATIDFIKGEGWTAVGYDSFEKFWTDRMTDITIATELRPEVVFALFDEGVLPDEISNLVKGVGAKTAGRWKQEHNAGVPASQASRKGRTDASQPLPYETLFLHLPRASARKLRKIAAEHDIKPEQLAHAAIESLIEEMSK